MYQGGALANQDKRFASAQHRHDTAEPEERGEFDGERVYYVTDAERFEDGDVIVGERAIVGPFTRNEAIEKAREFQRGEFTKGVKWITRKDMKRAEEDQGREFDLQRRDGGRDE